MQRYDRRNPRWHQYITQAHHHYDERNYYEQVYIYFHGSIQIIVECWLLKNLELLGCWPILGLTYFGVRLLFKNRCTFPVHYLHTDNKTNESNLLHSLVECVQWTNKISFCSEIKNKVTGVDIYVSDYQEVPHRVKDEHLYHVIVVSNLFYYKTRQHRENDVVQFMVCAGGQSSLIPARMPI